MSPDEARAAVDRAVRRTLSGSGADRRVGVAFSGGPDSTALLRSLARLRSRRPPGVVGVAALHVDHGADDDSPRRAACARSLARAASVAFFLETAEPPPTSGRSRGPEAEARNRRYRALAALADEAGCDEIWTAHHRDDQAETVALRLSRGTGLRGLGGIEPRQGRWVRPLLDLPRTLLEASLADQEPPPVHDPTNRDLRRPRNRLRQAALPSWSAVDPVLPERLASLAGTARRVRDRIDALLGQRLELGRTPRGARLSRREWSRLPAPLRPWALAGLHRAAGAPYPARERARRELMRQLERQEVARCPAGAGFHWEADGRTIRLHRPEDGTPPFHRSVPGVPSELAIPEVGLRLRLELLAPADWMLEGRRRAAGLRPPDRASPGLAVRNRRPGDRFRPIGAPGARRLKKLLIDRKIPRGERDRLPLLLVDGEIAWVPGVAVGERFRLRGDEEVVWAARLVAEPDRNGTTESFVGSFGLDRA